MITEDARNYLNNQIADIENSINRNMQFFKSLDCIRDKGELLDANNHLTDGINKLRGIVARVK